MRKAKVDRNQPEIVAAFRALGCTVAHTHMVGQGFPDIVVGCQGENYLIEIKDGSLSPSRRQLTEPEAQWHQAWGGQVAIVETIDDVRELVADWRAE